MEKMKKLVSVIIPTYKHADTLLRAINSVLNQTYQNCEIIVVDDNSPDSKEREETQNVMKQFMGNRSVQYIQHKQNKNGSAARNTGIGASKGDFIMFLDDDDEFYPRKVEKQISALQSLDNSWGACYTNYECKLGNQLLYTSVETIQGNILKEQLKRNVWLAAGSNMMVRRSVIEDIGLWDESFKRNQDVEYFARIASQYKIAYVPGIELCIYAFPKKRTLGVTYEELTAKFIENFKKYIDAFSKTEQKEIYLMLNLQIFRNYLFSRYDLKSAFKMIAINRVDAYNAFIYSCHLVYRKIRKIGIGYRIR
ncbi:glycosyltransferase family 2 protein [Phocaeicola faecalis]|uniref:glycosyltransferase family 2 protein n=1 Tax=Phocaeicola faecalis TaxID=2786956 RepID=UPI001F405FB5|nr:glycosyltransferase family 2 protein [Phocaeicola faecalis]